MNDSALELLYEPDYRVPPDELERLESLGETGLLDTPAEEGFDRITRLAQKLFGVSAASVSLIADDRQFLKSVAGDLENNSPRGVSFCTHTILTPGALIVEDANDDDRFSNNPLVIGKPNIRFYAGQPLQGPGGYNIGTLCITDQKPRAFNVEQQEILQDLAAIAQREINVRTDLKTGAKIQQAHLPQQAPDLTGYTITAASHPAGDLSGDFYDWYPGNGLFRFTLADVMGKGTGPAILTATVRAGLRSASDPDPARALAALSAELLTNLAQTESFVTCFHGELDPSTGTIRYSDAGHGLAHYVPNQGPIKRLPTTSAPLGIMPGMQWRTETLTLAPGEALIIPSDGALELLDDDLEQLATALHKLSTSTDIHSDIRTLVGGQNLLTDDLTVLVVRRDYSSPAP